MRISDWSSDVCSSDLIVEIEEKVVKRAFVGQLETPADPAVLDALADLETGCRQAGHTKKAGLVEPAGQQPARIVLAILQIEAPGEVDRPINGGQGTGRQIRPALNQILHAAGRIREPVGATGNRKD